MPTLAFSSVGSKLSLSAGVPATTNSAGFAALTYTEVKEITDLGALGPESSVIMHQPVNENVTYKLKGSKNFGTLTIKAARAPTDPGQLLVIAAEVSNNPYAMKLELQNGTIMYAQVLVMSYKTGVGGQSQIVSVDITMEISGAIITA